MRRPILEPGNVLYSTITTSCLTNLETGCLNSHSTLEFILGIIPQNWMAKCKTKPSLLENFPLNYLLHYFSEIWSSKGHLSMHSNPFYISSSIYDSISAPLLPYLKPSRVLRTVAFKTLAFMCSCVEHKNTIRVFGAYKTTFRSLLATSKRPFLIAEWI